MFTIITDVASFVLTSASGDESESKELCHLHSHLAPPRGYIGLLLRFELGVQWVHLLRFLHLFFPPLVPLSQVQVLDETKGRKTGTMVVKNYRRLRTQVILAKHF